MNELMTDDVEKDRDDSLRPTLSVLDIQPELISAVSHGLAEGDLESVRTLIEPLHAADIALLLQHLAVENRFVLVNTLPVDFLPDVLAELDETVRDDIIDALGPIETAKAVADMDTDDAVNVIADLDEVDQQLVLSAIPAPERELLVKSLTYREYTAGRLMQHEMVAVPAFWSVGETIDHLRQTAEDDPDSFPTNFYDIFVVDRGQRPVGAIPISRLLRARRDTSLSEIMETEMKVISTDADQEDVAFLFRQRDLTSAPVVDNVGCLVGVITIDDIVDVIDEEHEDDIMHLGGVATDDFYSVAIDAARSRFTWLLVNLGTAVLASLVIGLFDASIEKMVALAVLMPIVASMGGNAGTQTLTIAVRALATKELTTSNALRVIGKELLVGVINGALFAVITGTVAYLWFGDPGLAFVIGLAMMVNLVTAALGGSTIPLILNRFKIDPAVASTVFLTTLTDVVGFFAFLGLASAFLL